MNAMRGPTRIGPGFTLVELLCCCAVVAVLTSLLLPALAGARENGRAAACMSGLRQLQLALDIYSTEQRSFYAPGAAEFVVNRQRWFGSRPGPSGPFESTGGPLSEHVGGAVSSVRRCPTFQSSTTVGAFERHCGGYGYNTSFVGTLGRWTAGVRTVATDLSGELSARMTRPAGTISFGDTALWNGTGLIEYSFVEPRRWPADPPSRPDPSLHFRHGRGAKVGTAQAAWLDGHVAPLERSATWSSGVFGAPPGDQRLGWPGDADDNTLYGGR